MREALENERAYNGTSTLLVTSGGGMIGFATFAGGVAPRLANTGAGVLVAGVVLIHAHRQLAAMARSIERNLTWRSSTTWW